ncbi:MAG: hypothetical protein IKA64_01990 [Clostridia bacterium]|nr:hypothetical protein [Clostridia bacterium]
MEFLPLIWKQHRHREDFNSCPHCEAPLRWIYDGERWLPCDEEPVLFVMHPTGRVNLVYEKKVIEKCLLYRKGDRRCEGKPLWAYRQHYYTCPVLKARRAEYVRARYEGIADKCTQALPPEPITQANIFGALKKIKEKAAAEGASRLEEGDLPF